MSKILCINYDGQSPRIIAKEMDITEDELQQIDQGDLDLFRYSERAGGVWERAIVSSEDEASEDDDGNETLDTTWTLDHWEVVE